RRYLDALGPLCRVIRRQFRTVEGDPFNPRAIRAAAERIRALGFFADVDVQTRSGSSEDQVIVDVDVTEQPTGSFGFGASYSVANGVGFVVTFSESNFLGRGQSLQVDLNTTGSTGRSAFRFTEPAFLGRDVALGFGISQSETNRDNSFYSTKELAADISLRFPIGEQTAATLRYGISLDEIYDVDVGSSVILQDEADERLTSALGYTLTFDSRTSGLNPNAGVLLSFGQDFAGLGGDVRSVRTTARVIGQTRVRNEEVTLRATLEGGALNMLGGDVSTVNDRYFLSSRQLRGFAYKGVGPRDFTADNEDVLGGNYFVSARLEGEFPLGLPEEFGLTGGVFLDAASIWGLDNTSGTAGTVDDDLAIRSSIGVSLFWTTPIGPLVFSYARPLNKEPGDEVQYFDVTISTRF
ncbi:MAG: outer membrane protein assembly factor BamA, partial [Rhodobacteraceae bacterium]